MDVTAVPEPPNDPSTAPPTDLAAGHDVNAPRVLHPIPSGTPLAHGIKMSIAGCLSTFLLLCFIASAGELLDISHPRLLAGIVVMSIIVGIFVGIRSWRGARSPKPLSPDLCPACNRELTNLGNICPTCGRSR